MHCIPASRARGRGGLQGDMSVCLCVLLPFVFEEAEVVPFLLTAGLICDFLPEAVPTVYSVLQLQWALSL